MQDWLIWIGSTLVIALFSLLMGLLKDYNEVAAGLVALVIGILVMIFILPMAF
jgi:hypothetical protein